MEKLVVVICICVFLFALGCKENTTGPSETPDLWQSQPNQSIVFISKVDNSEGEIYLLDKSGSITRLTNNSRYENSPAISRDGTSIAFQAGDL